MKLLGTCHAVMHQYFFIFLSFFLPQKIKKKELKFKPELLNLLKQPLQ